VAPEGNDRGSPASGESTRHRILVVDDETEVLRYLNELLESRGYEVVALVSPMEALQQARIQKFDALVLDLYMPEMSGMLLYAKLRVFDPELARRTVFVSGYVAREELRAKLNAAPNYLEKPFKPEDILRIVADLLPPQPRRAGPAGGAP
jgi:CheY-like chemotaxis protein